LAKSQIGRFAQLEILSIPPGENAIVPGIRNVKMNFPTPLVNSHGGGRKELYSSDAVEAVLAKVRLSQDTKGAGTELSRRSACDQVNSQGCHHERGQEAADRSATGSRTWVTSASPGMRVSA
jgi:hypothetical protein